MNLVATCFRMLIVFAVLGSSVLLAPTRAEAYAFTGCRLSGTNPQVYWAPYSLTAVNLDHSQNAASRWTSVNVPGYWTQNSGGVISSNQIGVSDDNFSWTAYATTSWTCQGGVYRLNSVFVRYNLRTMSPLAYWQEKFVVVHEFGHVLGLDHVTTGCNISVMRGDAVTGTASCSSGNPPWYDDINGVNARY